VSGSTRALTPAESFILLYSLDGGEAMLWELPHMRVVFYDKSEARTIGPGTIVTDQGARFRLAKKSALALLEKGFVEVRKGQDFGGSQEGQVVPIDEARRELAKGDNWLTPMDRKRDVYFWLEMTDGGEAALPSIPREGIPSVAGKAE
jgi:hypothetical protein